MTVTLAQPDAVTELDREEDWVGVMVDEMDEEGVEDAVPEVHSVAETLDEALVDLEGLLV